MNLPTEPRLPKAPFILTDVACLLAAALIGFYAKDPFAPLPFLSAVALVAAGGVALLIPFLADYGADCRESAREQHHQLELQIKRLLAAGESLTRAAAQIKAVEEAAHKSAHAAENLPYRMQEKLAEFNEALAGQEADDREALEQELTELRAANSDQLKAVADKIQKAATEWSALEAASRRHLAAAQDVTARLEKRISATVAQLAHAAPVAAASTPAPVEDRPAEPVAEATPAETSAVETPDSASEPAAPTESAPAEPPKPKKPRAPRKPKVEEPAAPEIPAPAAEPAPETERIQPPGLTTFPAAMGDLPRGESAESSASSDGATRLLATAYIGIGNKLFIRGDGPGLSWDTGAPMQFVSIGKWGWATHDATAPIRAKLYKNDETAALSGEITLEPNRHTEVTALF